MELPEQLIKAVENHNINELALGWVRYEKLRRLSPREYGELCKKNLLGGERFDDLVDQLSINL